MASEDFDEPPNDFTELALGGTVGADAMLALLEGRRAFEDFERPPWQELALEQELELVLESSSDFEAPAADFTELELDGTLGFDAMLASLAGSLLFEYFDDPPNDCVERKPDCTFVFSALFFRLIMVGDTYAVMGRIGAVLVLSVPALAAFCGKL